MRKKVLFICMIMLLSIGAKAKTLVAYYSYTSNCRNIVASLTSQIEADVLEIQPAVKGLQYDANNYALGTQLLNAIKANPDDASSYPAIDPVTVNLNDYNTVIIVTPLWWSQMAAIMQTFLFNYGPQMAGKNIGLIVSSASSGISGVVADCKRLVPAGNYFSQNLWINNSNRSNRNTLIQNWLSAINYQEVADISQTPIELSDQYDVYSLDGKRILVKTRSLDGLKKGAYIVNGEKRIIE